MTFDPSGLTVYLDGEYVPGGEARPCRSWDRGVLYGDGIFEGMRLFSGSLFRPYDHLARLADSARALGLELPLAGDALLDVICQVIVRSRLEDAHVRPIVTRGFGAPGVDPARCERSSLFVAAYPFPPLLGSDPIRVLISSIVRKAPRSVGAHVKSLNYLDAVLAKRQANAAGAGDAVMLRPPGSGRRVHGGEPLRRDRRDARHAHAEVGPPRHHAPHTILEVAGEQGIPFEVRATLLLADGALHGRRDVPDRVGRWHRPRRPGRRERARDRGERGRRRCLRGLLGLHPRPPSPRARRRSCVSPSVIVVGAGIFGATTAWALAHEGVDVLVLDAGRIGGGMTSKSGAIIRCHYSNPEVVRMAVHSRETYRRLPLYLDCDPVYHTAGWLFLVDESEAAQAVANSEMQNGEGLDSVEVDDLGDVLPGVDATGVAYALYEPESGFVDAGCSRPRRTSRPCAAWAARARGGTREVGVDPEVEAGKVRGVRVGGELHFRARRVVLARRARGRSRSGAPPGVELPLEITRGSEGRVIFDAGPGARHPRAPSPRRPTARTIAPRTPEFGPSCLRAGLGYPKDYEQVDPAVYDTEVDDSFEADTRDRVVGRVPRLEGMRRVGGVVGLYDVTPDWHPILGRTPEVEGLVLAMGGNGHCFKLAPAIGDLVAASVLEEQGRVCRRSRRSPVERFAQGRELRSTYGGNRG